MVEVNKFHNLLIIKKKLTKNEKIRLKLFLELPIAKIAINKIIIQEFKVRTCVYSGKLITWTDALLAENCNLDHIIAKTKGGANEPSNLVLANNLANSQKGDKTAYEAFMNDWSNVSQRIANSYMDKSKKNLLLKK